MNLLTTPLQTNSLKQHRKDLRHLRTVKISFVGTGFKISKREKEENNPKKQGGGGVRSAQNKWTTALVLALWLCVAVMKMPALLSWAVPLFWNDDVLSKKKKKKRAAPTLKKKKDEGN